MWSEVKPSSNVVDGSNHENKFPNKLLLANTQALRHPKAFTNNSSPNIKLSKTWSHKIRQSRGFLGRLLGPIVKKGLPWMKNILKALAKSALIPLGLTAAASARDAVIYKKQFDRVLLH